MSSEVQVPERRGEESAARHASTTALFGPQSGRQVPVSYGAALLFLSGMCSLIFQVSWFREFRLVFGASTAASSTVLAVFMGGLGLGNLLFGARVDRSTNPLRFYAALELCIALTTAVSPILIDALHAIYFSLGGQQTLGFSGATLLRLLICAIVLGIPTLLMGGTLPAAVRAVTTGEDRERRAAAVLYGVNTLGAVFGAFSSTFLVIQLLGNRNTLWLACLVNAATACSAFALSRGRSLETSGPSTLVPSPKSAELCATPEMPAGTSRVIYAVSALAGFSFFLMELVWYRMLGPILGGTTFAFGLILGIALSGIGLGAAAYSLIFSRRRQVSIDSLALVCALEACCILLPFALGDQIALLAASLRESNASSFAGAVAGWFVVAGIVILPAAFVSGVQFPMLITLLGQGDRHIGREVGRVFGWNTIGAILGSLAGGFGLLPLLSGPGVWRAVAIVLVLQGLVLAGWARRGNRWSATAGFTLLLTALGLAMSAATGPTAVWRHSGIGAGRGIALDQLENENSSRLWQNEVRRTIVWETDGVESSVAIEAKNGISFFVNGKSDGNAVHDAGTQIMLGLIGAALHPEPKSAMIVGLGTGETAGWLAEMPSISQVDVIELEPAICEVARRCRDVNHDVLAHPKVGLIFNDAREVLLTTASHYDLIVCEPSNPYRSGVANLFTQEFYRAGKERLNEGGLFVQWIQAYETDERTMRTVFATFKSVFPHVEVWEPQPDDLVLVGSLRPRETSAPELREKLAAEPLASALIYAWRTTGLEGFLSHFVGGQKLVDAFIASGDWAVNTDDRNEIEYAFARTLGVTNPSTTKMLYRIGADLSDQRHPMTGGNVDWDSVELNRQWFAPTVTVVTKDRPLDRVLERYRARDLQGTLSAWEAAAHDSVCLRQWVIVALGYAGLGDDKAEAMAQRLQPYLPIEADMVRGILAWKQNRAEDSARILADAIRRLRKDPWPMALLRESAFEAAIAVAAHGPEQATALLDAFSEPFAVLVADESRRECGTFIAAHGAPHDVLPFLESYEPHVLWTNRFLSFRREIYGQTRHRLTRQANQDLERFLQYAAAR